jgi:hypothetical protein
MLKAVEFGLLAVTILVIFGLIVVGPGAYSRNREDGDVELGPDGTPVNSTKV